MKYFLIFVGIFLLSILGCNSPTENGGPPVQEPDSTSHNFIWEIDTIGTFQSYLLDVWAADENNAYAVGFMYLRDTSYDWMTVVKWNGTRWTNFARLWGEYQGIFGFSNNNIYAVGYWGDPIGEVDGLIAHYDGTKWDSTILDFSASLRDIWGSSANDIYAVGAKGTIVHYNGSVWSKVNSPTTRYLTKIWGTSATNIYACGGTSDGEGVLLKYDGKKWSIIYENGYQPNRASGRTSAIFGYDSLNYSLSCGSGDFLGQDSKWTIIYPPVDNTYITNIHGSSYKNIFWVGHFGLIAHWNGKSWHRYEQFFRKPEGDLLQSVWATKTHVFIVGRSDVGAKGIIYRGKMVQ